MRRRAACRRSRSRSTSTRTAFSRFTRRTWRRQGSEDHRHRELRRERGGHPADEIAEAKEHEAEDKERREQIERRNKLDNLCYTLERPSREQDKKIGTCESRRFIPRRAAGVEKQDTSREERWRAPGEGSAPDRERDVQGPVGKGQQPGAGRRRRGLVGWRGAGGDAGGNGKKKDGGVIERSLRDAVTSVLAED